MRFEAEHGPLAQLDRALHYECRGREFESPTALRLVGTPRSATWRGTPVSHYHACDLGGCTVSPAVAAEEDVRAAIAYRIRAELVCCDVYERDHDTDRAGRTHAICFWGEAAARIAEEIPVDPAS